MVNGCCQLLATKLSQSPQSVSVTVYHDSLHLHYHRPSSVVAFCDCILVTKSLSNTLVILVTYLLRHYPLKKWKTVEQWHSQISVGSLTEALLSTRHLQDDRSTRVNNLPKVIDRKITSTMSY